MYSGKRSEKFWKAIWNHSDYMDADLYLLGCRLQEIEGKTLKNLALAAEMAKKKKCKACRKRAGSAEE